MAINKMGRGEMLKAKIFLIAISLSAAAEARAASYTYVTIASPDGSPTEALNLNDSGAVVGFYETGSGADGTARMHAFLFQDGIFSTVDPPSASNAQAFGISSDGTVVGAFQVGESLRTDGFTYKNGVFSTFGHDGFGTSVDATSRSGIAAGTTYAYAHPSTRIFFLHGGTAAVKSVMASQGAFKAINNLGIAVGDFYPLKTGTSSTTLPPLFGYVFKNGKPAVITKPGATDVYPQDINDGGVIVGRFTDPALQHEKGFIEASGVFTDVVDPDPDFPNTVVFGINDAGDVIGTGSTDTSLLTEAFVRHAGSTEILRPPGIMRDFGAQGVAINTSGQVLLVAYASSGQFVSLLGTAK